MKAVKGTLNKSKSIALRLNMLDVTAIKRKSRDTGTPYQTLIASILHQYATGRLHIEL